MEIITPMLAETAPLSLDQPIVIAVLCLLGFAALAAAINQIWKLADRFKQKPHPGDVQRESAAKFATKSEFNQHVRGNTERHGQLFDKIDRTERAIRSDMDQRFLNLAEDRKETMEKLNTQFTFIRENISSINTELKIRNE